jgi:hypothetical protein
MITVKIYKEDDFAKFGYGRWFYQISRKGVLIKTGGGRFLESQVRRELSQFARHSHLVGEEAYAVDLAAHPTYHDGTPRKAWADLGNVERWSWSKTKESAA